MHGAGPSGTPPSRRARPVPWRSDVHDPPWREGVRRPLAKPSKPGQRGDGPQPIPDLEHIRTKRPDGRSSTYRPDHLFGDTAYSSRRTPLPAWTPDQAQHPGAGGPAGQASAPRQPRRPACGLRRGAGQAPDRGRAEDQPVQALPDATTRYDERAVHSGRRPPAGAASRGLVPARRRSRLPLLAHPGLSPPPVPFPNPSSLSGYAVCRPRRPRTEAGRRSRDRASASRASAGRSSGVQGRSGLTACGRPRAAPPASGAPSPVGRFRCSH